MTFSRLLKALSEYGRTVMGKSRDANAVAEIIEAQAKMTSEYAQSVLKKPHLSEDHLMTTSEAKQLHREWCLSQVGYHENPDGSNKYGEGDWDEKLYGFDIKDAPWCDGFADYSYIAVFGYDAATKMTYQSPSGYAACKLSADAYKKNGAFYSKPELEDQIFFYYGGDINHTGIVVDIDGDTITCVEGNYSNGVYLTKYNVNNQWLIAGYGRPDWSVVSDVEAQTDEDDTKEVPQFDIIHPKYRRTYMHLEYGDGKGNPLPQVKAWQNLLLCWGFDIGQWGADGEFGTDTLNATRQWQKKALEMGAEVEVNGVVDEDDWIAVLEVPV